MTDSSEAMMSKPADHLRTLHEKDQEKRLIVVLENASLETVKVRTLYPCTTFLLFCVCLDENSCNLLPLIAAKLKHAGTPGQPTLGPATITC